jgi:hypothetical protein
MMRLALGTVVVSLAAASALVAADPPPGIPSISSVAPLAIAPGTATKISLVGANLAVEPQLWTGFPVAQAAWIKPAESKKPDLTHAAFTLQPDPSVGPGIYGLRVVTPGGVSNLKLIMVDDLPTVPEKSDNKSREKAQTLKLPVAIDAACEAETSDFYAFEVKAGDRLSIETVARRLGTPVDATIRLLDAAGRELAYADDDETAGADARLSHRFEQAGQYFVEVRDVRYLGSGSYRYRLRIGNFPLAATPYPAAVQKGAKATVEVATLDGGQLQPIAVAVPADSAERFHGLAVSYGKGQGSGFTTALVGDGAEQIETEPNDSPEQAAPLETAGAMNGRIAAPGDRDYFRFRAKKGNQIRFVGRTRSFGSPTDLYLRLFSGDGKRQLAEADDQGLDEGALEAKIDADGEYLLVVEDLIGRGGPAYTYRLEIDVDRPRLAVSLDADKYDVPRAGIAQLKATIVRGGFEGPVRFRFEGGPEGVQLITGANLGTTGSLLTLFVPSSVAPGTPLVGRVLAEATAGDVQLAVPAGTSSALKKSLGGVAPPALDGLVAVGVAAADVAYFQFSTKTPTVAVAPGAKKAEFVVAVDRQKAAKDAVVDLNVYGLPAGFKAAPVKIDKGKNEATLVVECPADAKPQEIAFVVVGTSTVTKKMVQGSLADLKLAVGSTTTTSATKPPAAKPATTKPAEKKPAGKPVAAAKQPTTVAVRKPTQVEP